MPLDVEYKVSLHESKHMGRWNINGDKGTITFNIPNLYRHAKKIMTEWRGYECEDGDPCESGFIDEFMKLLIETDLIERICIERAYQKIRLKGHSRCKPFCVCARPALCMAYPYAWKPVRDYVGALRKKAAEDAKA